MEKEYGKKVRLVWKNYPLPFHNNAEPAAEAAMAAHAQGKFWEMHDTLFTNNTALERATWRSTPRTSGSTWPSSRPTWTPRSTRTQSRPRPKRVRPWA